MVFLDNFDPTTSNRERRKQNPKSYNYRKQKKLYNERGQIAATGQDFCDCLDVKCPGCHFPCLKCSSNKCGPECRVNRNWMYEKIETEGNDTVIINTMNKK
ncbi:unnamed protein product [Leptosia nina]|uniref:ARF7 effector protein C-terminal domain-containing protein n=1 Tax=Leptosia nina TaxID=320188 RepID=A0AAV1IWF4_9NEOP